MKKYNEQELIKFVALNAITETIIGIVRDSTEINKLIDKIKEAPMDKRHEMCLDASKFPVKHFNKMILKYQKENKTDFTEKVIAANKYLKSRTND